MPAGSRRLGIRPSMRQSMSRRFAIAATAILVLACNRADRPAVTAPVAKPAFPTAAMLRSIACR